MALATIIQSAADSAFAVADDLLVPFIFENRTPDGLYNPQTGSREVAVDRFELRGIRTDNPRRAIDGGLASEGDLSLLVKNTIISEMVKVNTQATDASGNVWFVVLVNRDPADATIDFLLRRRGV